MDVIYNDEGIVFGKDGEKYTLQLDGNTYILESSIYEPCIYMKGSDRTLRTIHHAFTMDELVKVIQTNGTIGVNSGNKHDVKGVFKLLRRATKIAKDDFDLSYVENCCFLDYMKERGAVSPETAVSPSDIGLDRCPMSSFVHANKVTWTSDNRCYLLGEEPPREKADRFSRVISNQVRFGYGYRTIDGYKQFYAWHGVPNRNDDFFTTAEITEDEFDQIEKEYPFELSADRETAEKFRSKYVDGHFVILEGWNKIP